MDMVDIIGALIGYRLTSNATYVVSYHPIFSDPTFFSNQLVHSLRIKVQIS